MKDSQGRVNIKVYDSGRLISAQESYSDISRGIVDFGEGVVAYIFGGFPLLNAWPNFAYGLTDAASLRLLSNEINEQFPEIQAEFSSTHLLLNTSPAPYQLISRKPINTLADLRGLKLRTISAYTRVFQALGADPVDMPATETFIGLQKGIIDGSLNAVGDLKSLKLSEVAKYVTYVNLGAAPFGHKFMNPNSWNNLPIDIRNLFEANLSWWAAESDSETASSDLAGFEYGKTQGVVFITFTPEEYVKFDSVVDTQMKGIASGLDAKGLPGTKIFNQVRNLVIKYNR
jgi:TRAP-type transport system periplasmic protein